MKSQQNMATAAISSTSVSTPGKGRLEHIRHQAGHHEGEQHAVKHVDKIQGAEHADDSEDDTRHSVKGIWPARRLDNYLLARVLAGFAAGTFGRDFHSLRSFLHSFIVHNRQIYYFFS